MGADGVHEEPRSAAAADVARKFLAELMDHKQLRALLSDEHFSVDGTQIAAWASMKSFKAKDGSAIRRLGAQRRARFSRREAQQRHACLEHGSGGATLSQGTRQEAKLTFMGHALMENRSGHIIAATLTKVTGTAERQAAEAMIVRHSPGLVASPWAPTRVMTQPRSSPTYARST